MNAELAQDFDRAVIEYTRALQEHPYDGGARAGKPDPYVDGARTLAGLDRGGVSAAPARSFDPYSEGSRVGGFDPYGEGARA